MSGEVLILQLFVLAPLCFLAITVMTGGHNIVPYGSASTTFWFDVVNSDIVMIHAITTILACESISEKNISSCASGIHRSTEASNVAFQPNNGWKLVNLTDRSHNFIIFRDDLCFRSDNKAHGLFPRDQVDRFIRCV
jgi:hypothetical protein